MSVDENLDVAIHHLERVLSSQLDSVEGLSNKAGTLLGFVLASFAAMFAVSRDILQAHQGAASLAASLLAVSAAGLGYSYRLTTYLNPPQPRRLLSFMHRTSLQLKIEVLVTLAEAHTRNTRVIERRFQFVNTSLAFFIGGVSLFVVGVVMV